MQKWEIAGISIAPIIECVMALNLHGAIGLTDAGLLHVVAALATLAAIVRATLDKRKAAS